MKNSNPTQRGISPKDILFTVFTLLFLIAGISLLLYPTFSNEWNKVHQTRTIATYEDCVENTGKDKLDAMWEDAVKYNSDLRGYADRFHMTEDQLRTYENTLDISGTGIMGYIEIPQLDIYLPIFHDTNEGVLEVAVGHLAGSSLPVDSMGTNIVLAGHTGLPTRKLFTDIDKMKEGDTFELIVLGRVLTYEVDRIEVVLPEKVESLGIDDDRNYCTLVTCTPYGVNTHRLIVRGKWIRTEYVEDVPTEPSIDLSENAQNRRLFLLALPFIGAAAAFAIFVGCLAIRRKRSSK